MTNKRGYMRVYLEKNKEKIKLQNSEWYRKNINRHKEIMEGYRNNIHFGGNREKALERDNYGCRLCHKTHHEVLLTVHHSDFKGRGCNNPNNNLDNLITLCNSCHAKIHRRRSRFSF